MGDERIEDAAPAEPVAPGVAAFDFDGTLVSGDSLLPFLARLRGVAGFAGALAGAAPGLAAAASARSRDRGKAELLRRTVGGLDVATVEAAGREFAARLAQRVRPDRRVLVEGHRRKGHRLVLVSASLAVYLEPFATAVGFDDVIATRLEAGPDGRLTGRLCGPNVRGREKADRLRALLGPGPHELWAYGDSAGDDAMLAMADHPVRVGRRT